MSDAPNDLKYTKSHEWVAMNDDGSVTVGVTDHAQELLGDLNDQLELATLVIGRNRVAFFGRREAALRCNTELIDIDVL